MAHLSIKDWPVDWDVWGKADVVELHQAISLSLDVDPDELFAAWKVSGRNLDFLASDERRLFKERIKLCKSHLGRALVVAVAISASARTRTHPFQRQADQAHRWRDLACRYPRGDGHGASVQEGHSSPRLGWKGECKPDHGLPGGSACSGWDRRSASGEVAGQGDVPALRTRAGLAT